MIGVEACMYMYTPILVVLVEIEQWPTEEGVRGIRTPPIGV